MRASRRDRCAVVVNNAGQYSVWPASRPVPIGWHAVGVHGGEADCLDWIGRHWTGVRPAAGTTSGEPERPVLDAGEVRDIIAAGTGPDAFDDAGTVADLIERAAARYPERPAVTYAGESLSYAELELRTRAVAQRLRGVGAGTDTVVAVHADRSLHLVVALVGILRAGAAYLPLDPAYPARRCADMVRDAAPVLLLADGTDPGFAPGCPVLELRELAGSGPDREEPELVPYRHPESLAYVIFTSGSTGRPKGVQNIHRALANRLRWMQSAYRLGAGDTVLQKTPISFDVSVWELFWPLTAGAHLVVAPPGSHRDPDELAALIRTHRVTVVHFVPSMLRAFLRAGAAAGCPSLRDVICSGEVLPPDLRADFLARSGARLHNLYGPTEAAIDVTHYDCVPVRDPDTVPIGVPISGLRVHVLGPDGGLLRAGVTGELYLGGIGLARGYAGRPATTAERFLPDPYGAPGDRLYRTGDLGLRRPDGLIEFLGRADDQVALRGFRIELGEVQAAIERVAGVRQAVATMWSDGSSGAGLAGYVVAAQAAGYQDHDLLVRVRAELADMLPDYMIPTVWSILPELPTLPSGKVDRGRLPAPVLRPDHGTDRTGPAPAGERPWTELEQAVAGAWERVLGTPPRHLDDDFFRCGGDSILSVELVVAVRAAGLSLTVGKTFANATLRRLAAVVDRDDPVAELEPGPFALVSAEQRDRLEHAVEDAFPLSTLLSGLLYEYRVNPQYRVYTTSLHLIGELDEALLERAVAVLLRRHPFLRSSVDLDSYDEPLQLVHHRVRTPLTVVDLSDLEPSRRQAAFARWLAAEPRHRFDWSVPPLLRLTAHRLTDTEFRLTLAEPYLDGWSVTLALNELIEQYHKLLDGQRPDPTTPVPVQAAFLRGERAALADDRTRAYWRSVLADPPPGLLVRSRRPTGPRVRDVPVTAATARRLRALADRAGVSVKSVLLAAHVQVVALLTGRTEVLTGLIANARPETAPGARGIGMFLNTIPLRVDVAAGRGRDLVTAVHAAEAATLPHRAYPYAQMLHDSGLAGPLDTAFNYTHFRPYRRLVGDDRLRLRSIDATDQTYHRLTAQFRQDVTDDRIAVTLEFAGGAFGEDQIDRIVGYYEAAVRQLAEDPDRPVAPLERLLPAAERRALAAAGAPAPAGTNAAAPDLYRLFARQAERTPDAEALRYGTGSVSYGGLAARTADLARVLAARGIGPGSVVAVHLERSPGYVAAVLAVLRAGAAYLPLDPLQPAERLATILAASGARAILTGAGHADRLPDHTTPLRVEVDRLEVDGPDVPAVPVTPDAAAVVVFTSGSTGLPKGVVLTHAAVLNRLGWALTDEPAEDGDTYLLRTPIGFVDAVAELFDGLIRGVPTVILPDHVRAPDELVSVLATNGVTKVTLVPTLLSEILRLGPDQVRRLDRVRLWHLSGEPLRDELVRALHAYLPGAVVRNIYGSTEVCADVTVHTCTWDEGSVLVPIGTALPGTGVRVLHEDGGLAPIGTPGELAVSGRALAAGYLGDGRATAQRFTPSPLGDGERLYRTGDLAVRGTDGVLELLGRTDRQIKARGVRVEPAEVEANLVAHPDVAEALVMQRKHAGRPVLVGYVRSTLPAASLGAMLRAFLRDRLPNAAIPQAFVAVADWPRLASGKVDVSGLTAPVPSAGRRGTGAVPIDPLEAGLAELWHHELGVAPNDVDDDFWALGGHSLIAARLARSIERRFGARFGIADLYTHPTLAAQARLVRRLRDRS